MIQNKISILSTRALKEDWIEEAAQIDIEIEINSFIETETIQSVEVLQEIEFALLQSANVVFTSVNAVNAVGENLEEQQPDWRIYCIGHATKQQVEEYFDEKMVRGFANSAEELAELIATGSCDTNHGDTNHGDTNRGVIFFCGSKRREELPEILKSNGIEVNEIVVYETITTPHKLQKHCNGILFFSPSAVESFFQFNKPDKETVLFAIGNTTASSIKKLSNNKIIVSDEPSKEGMLGKLKEYYEK
jgi:uroporphyrinogen-III synthase